MFKSQAIFQNAYKKKFSEIAGKKYEDGTAWEQYQTLVMLIMEQIKLNWNQTNCNNAVNKKKQVYYFSMEFLIGKLLPYYLTNLGIGEVVQKGLKVLGIDLDILIDQEKDAGLGNGGLGRLAACFLDSMAFMGIPGHGNGIRYQFGLFEQKIVNGFQVEAQEEWLKEGYPWEIKKPEKSVIIKYFGNVDTVNNNGKLTFIHENYESVLAVPYDVPIVSYDSNENINTLRLWCAEPPADRQDYEPSCHQSAISHVLYPDDFSQSGKQLRLEQEYFFVAAGLSSIIQHFKKHNNSIFDLPNKVAVHINDTHPALCVPELMRILIDEEGIDWEDAWDITVNTISYTNHTIMPEALEKWQLHLVRYLLPRISMIIEEIDKRFKQDISSKNLANSELMRNTAIIWDDEIRMANLAVIGSHSVNGVSKLHSEILKNNVQPEFNTIYPHKYNNKTNGISHRRFLMEANPGLAELITQAIGEGWKKNSFELNNLVAYKEDSSFLTRLSEVKFRNKCRLQEYLFKTQGIKINPNAIFDVQVKRIHAYKRQLLNTLKIMDIYNLIKDHSHFTDVQHVFIFGGKAAPGYHYAKTIIKLINALAQKINKDQDLNDQLKVVFVENFNVSIAELIYPAADISEQISTASREASGTGNMKFMFNGAVTLGTPDGANVEIRNKVGDENIEIFGLTSDEVINYYRLGGYNALNEYENNPRLKIVIDQLVNGFFPDIEKEYQIIYNSLLEENDQFFVLKDFNPYIEGFNKLSLHFKKTESWQKTCLTNIAKAGYFSSDRSIKEYNQDIWRVDNTR
ncbi:glycogen/starch/alpha-glucan phosphorylase [Dehalobacter sp. DCM]|uniref:glycogen/starch/alpha-glucan phosphorylase n=1 Tax=Dehalobacter sp. DCM TaxID=2907827 RepID=UPI003081BEC9|nr:glycogen/starch/alpha-glucan phosphorylase [Dehalobacter sp. DCM]